MRSNQVCGALVCCSTALPAIRGEFHLDPKQVGLIGSSAVAGMAVGSWVWGWVADRLGRRLVFAATVLTFPLGWVTSRLLLAALYFGVFTPLGLVLRVLGRDALRLRACPKQASYWAEKPAPPDVSRYFRPF